MLRVVSVVVAIATAADDSSSVYCTSWLDLYSRFFAYKGSC